MPPSFLQPGLSAVHGVYAAPEDRESVFVFESRKDSGVFKALEGHAAIGGAFFDPLGEYLEVPLGGWRKMPRSQLLAELSDGSGSAPKSVWSDPETRRARFVTRCEDLAGRISRGKVKKAVPLEFLDVIDGMHAPSGVPAPDELKYLLSSALKAQAERGGWLYGSWTADSGILGVTPESLFERSGRLVRTQALAGTIPWSEDAAQLLMNDPKERAEHQWVIDGIVENLSDLGKLAIDPTGVKRAGDLLHLHTEIRLEANRPIDWRVLVERLHPTPALGAYPRGGEGEEFLRAQDRDCPRSRFGAPWGLSLPESEVFLVGIRNLEWSRKDRFCRIGAGVGYVSESRPEREWIEVQRKWASVRKILGLAETTA